jgi:two-component system OmpR family sensor kinase
VIARLSIRARLTIAFAAALLFVLALAAAFVYLQVRDTLTDSLDDRLETQASELGALVSRGGEGGGALPGPAESEDGFSQIVTPDGEVVASTLPAQAGSALDPDVLRRVATAQVVEELPVDGVDGEARILASPAGGPNGELVVVAGASTDDRAEALAGIAGAFALGAPLAVLLASGLGYLLAARSLAPVEAIRGRAGEITLKRSGERLPLPAADDEIRRLAETLNTMLDRIEASIARERTFVADAAHELRTPIAILRAELELAERPGRGAEEIRAALRSASEEAGRLSRLAEDLLVVARSDEGGLPIKRERVRVGELLESVASRVEPSVREAGREISVACPDGLEAELDVLRAEQALGNLVDNAIRHGRGVVRIAAEPAGDVLGLSVSDDGPGFAEGFEESAFDRFTRAEEARPGPGAGLGLAIVRVIAEAHGGSARIENTPTGCTVRMEIPQPERSSRPSSASHSRSVEPAA